MHGKKKYHVNHERFFDGGMAIWLRNWNSLASGREDHEIIVRKNGINASVMKTWMQ